MLNIFFVFFGFIKKVNLQDVLEFEKLAEINHGVHCNVLSLSPETNTSVLPTIIQFCTAGNDFKLRLFKGDLSEDNTCKVSLFYLNTQLRKSNLF